MTGIVAAVIEEIAALSFFWRSWPFRVMPLGTSRPMFDHRLLEEFAVLGLVDGVGGGADQFDIVALQRADLAQATARC